MAVAGGGGALGAGGRGPGGHSSLPPVACLLRKSAHEIKKQQRGQPAACDLEKKRIRESEKGTIAAWRPEKGEHQGAKGWENKGNAFVMTSKRKQLKKAFPIATATTTTNSVCRRPRRRRRLRGSAGVPFGGFFFRFSLLSQGRPCHRAPQSPPRPLTLDPPS